MAAPKLKAPAVVDADHPLLPKGELSRDERLSLLRAHPGVVSRHRGERQARPFVPSIRVTDDSMTLQDLFCLLGRDDEPTEDEGSVIEASDQP
jgi:hypothetical protein